ncbi:hypothetical protein HNQ94_000704 [Salirhabdus euzebyi]|uniref:Cytochrome c oxidase subunit 2A n=1 Tax=Salirhabdus euzebyi TaxID=394506 RepID=A0A841PTV0_9BACI|nr:cytochrome c oxidase subunit 2A [Salirhabdus euzebyi]MBB6452259.1 hypothetical protein [Salirhabdus euzebyi]
MSNTKPVKETDTNLRGIATDKESSSHEPNLKGTFIAVMGIGVIIVVSWFGVWSLFLSR